MSGEEDHEKNALVSQFDSNSKAQKSDCEHRKLLENAESCDVNDIDAKLDGISQRKDAEDNSSSKTQDNETKENTTDAKLTSDLNGANNIISKNEDNAENVTNATETITHVIDNANDGSNSIPKLDLQLQSQQNQQSTESTSQDVQYNIEGGVIMTQPSGLSPLYPPQLEGLLDCMQVVVHKDNLRHNIEISEEAVAKYEVINEARRVLFYVEKDPPQMMTEQSFVYRIYDKNKQPAIQVVNPQSSTLFMCHSSWHCLKKFKFQAVIMTPPGIVAGFVRRSHTCLLQEFEILSPQEDLLLLMRGGPYDLELYTPDLDTGIGRMAVHGWHGIMHEVKRSGGDIGLTFPIDLDVRVKAILVGAVFAIDWLYSTRNGTRT